MNKKCIFCEIIAGRSPETVIELENNELVVFKDIKPVSTFHLLAVSKTHYDSVKFLNNQHEDLINNMENSLKDMLITRGIDTNDALFGFHMPPFISVSHLHMHGIAPVSNMSFRHKLMFKPNSFWFKTVDVVRNILQEKVD